MIPWIVVGFLDAIGFAEFGEGEAPDNRENTFARYVSPDDMQMVKDFCTRFEDRAAPLLELAYERGYTEREAGRDLYFTYAGHGTGFWDRSELQEDGLGERLAEVCGRGEVVAWDNTEEDKEPEYGVSIEIY